MGIFRSEAVVQTASLSLAERYNVAQSLHGAAVSIFQNVAAQLDEARGHYETVAAEAQEEITRLANIRDESLTSANLARQSTDSALKLARGITK